MRGKKSLLGAQKEEGRGRRGRGSKYLKRSRVSRKKGEEKGGGFLVLVLLVVGGRGRACEKILGDKKSFLGGKKGEL